MHRLGMLWLVMHDSVQLARFVYTAYAVWVGRAWCLMLYNANLHL